MPWAEAERLAALRESPKARNTRTLNAFEPAWSWLIVDVTADLRGRVADASAEGTNGSQLEVWLPSLCGSVATSAGWALWRRSELQPRLRDIDRVETERNLLPLKVVIAGESEGEQVMVSWGLDFLSAKDSLILTFGGSESLG